MGFAPVFAPQAALDKGKYIVLYILWRRMV